LLEAEPFQRTKNIGAELDPGTDFMEFSRMLQHAHRKSLARERVRRRQPADAAARDQDRQRLTVRFCHRHSKSHSAQAQNGEPGWDRTSDLLIKSLVRVPRISAWVNTLSGDTRALSIGNIALSLGQVKTTHYIRGTGPGLHRSDT